MEEPVKPIQAEQKAIARTVANNAHTQGGREHTHDVDGVKQYPDLLQFDPVNMKAFTIITNLEIRKHS